MRVKESGKREREKGERDEKREREYIFKTMVAS